MELIKIHCTDNDKWVDADVLNHTDGWLVALLKPGDVKVHLKKTKPGLYVCLLYTSPSPRDGLLSRMPSSA